MSSQERDDDSPFHSLHNTIATLSNLLGLDATWKPISHVKTAMKCKLVVNSAINPFTALLGCCNGDLLESAEARKIISRMCVEAARAYSMQAESSLSCCACVADADLRSAVGRALGMDIGAA